MTRLIYLIRHGAPDTGGVKTCLGCRSDPPLSGDGILQAKALGSVFGDGDITALFSSPMLRCVKTAELLSEGRWSVGILPDMIEMDSGEWDGLPFSTIREKYPELYGIRSTDLSIPPPGGETYSDAGERGLACISDVLGKTEGDIAIVAHAGVNRAIISRLDGIGGNGIIEIPQSYSSVNVLSYDGEGFKVAAKGMMWDALPDDAEIRSMYAVCKTPENVIEHCKAVCRCALELAEKLRLDCELLSRACLTHDLCRTLPHHDAVTARFLRSRGYLRLAGTVERHHDIDPGGTFDEAKLLYLADKLTQGVKRVSPEERFSESLKKCRDSAAVLAHERRRRTAEAILLQYEKAVEEAE